MNVGLPGCPVMIYEGAHGQPRSCTGEPTHTAVVRWRARRVWVRLFFCRRHAHHVPDTAPMTPAHHELLAARRRDWQRGLAGHGYAGLATSTDRAEV